MAVRFAAALIVLALTVASASAQQLSFEAEASVATPLYNDVAVPNDATRLSIVDGWTTDPSFSPRIRLSALFADRHEVLALAALLRSSSYGAPGGMVDFAGERFDGRNFIDAHYRFDSYRASYRYHFLRGDGPRLALGATLKVRSAAIEFSQAGRSAEKTDLGVVPLIAFHASYPLGAWTSIMLDGDALAAPQGRAADVLLAVEHEVRDNLNMRLGARLLEGGADVDEVYNFSAFLYGVVGLRIAL